MVEGNSKRGRSVERHRKFFVFGPDTRGGGPGHGLFFENAKQLLTPPRLIVRPEEGGFPSLREKPRILYDRKRGKAPRDLEGGMSGYWLVSEQLKQIFEEVDPEGFAFAECDYILPDGSRGPAHYLCDVVRKIDALDEEKSVVQIEIEPSGRKLYSFIGGASLVFDCDIVGSAHVFNMEHKPSSNVCDDTLREACKALPDLKGIRFRDVQSL